MRAELDAEGIPFGIVDYTHPKFQQAYPEGARAEVFRSDIVSDDPSQNTNIIHEDFEYLAIDGDQNYNQLKVCVGRKIDTPVEWIMPGSGGLFSDERQTGFIIRERTGNHFGFVLGKFELFHSMTLLRESFSNTFNN